MNVELGVPAVRELRKRGNIVPETPAVLKRLLETQDEGRFLVALGISDAVIDFRQGFLGDMGSIRNEFEPVDEEKPFSRASIVLEWVEPNELKHFILKINVGISDQNEKYISASFKEIRHYKMKKHEADPPIFKIALMPLGRNFKFEDPVSNNSKESYTKWLREKILNYEIVWGNSDSL